MDNTARTWFDPERGGITWIDGPATSTAPSRFWLRAVRNPTDAAAANGERGLVGPTVVPNRIVADTSTTSQRSRSRSAICSRTNSLACSRRDVPVDAAHVVAQLVHPALAGSDAVAGREPLVVAVQDAVELDR